MKEICVEKYKVFDLELNGTKEGNPFCNIELRAEFTDKDQKIVTEGFYKGNGVCGIRFMPQSEGT